jgi:integrase
VSVQIIAAARRPVSPSPTSAAVTGGIIPIQTCRQHLVEAGLPRVRFHALRHAFATTLLADGEDLANVSKLLGHRDLAMTANIYGHLTDQASRRAADRMDRALRKAQ